jgi:hypothetical protein
MTTWSWSGINRIFKTNAAIFCIVLTILIYETQEERKDAEQRFILKASTKELAHIIDNSHVDGDSSFQITLTEIKVTVDLT